MTRDRVGVIMASIVAVGFVATAALHSSGFGAVVSASEPAPADVRSVVAPLWLAFGFHYAAFGFVLGALIPLGGRALRRALVLAVIPPVVDAGLQIRYFGFIPPTAVLLFLAAVSVIAAGVLPSRPAAGVSPQGPPAV